MWFHERGAGAPILLVRGFTIDHRMLLPLDAVFEDDKSGWRRLFVDLPGHGNSPRLPTMTVDSVVDDVTAFVREHIGDRKFAVVGISFGGQVARAVTARFGSQVLGSALLAPVVRPSADRSLPTDRTTTRDGAWLTQLPAEDREAFIVVTAQQDQDQWEAFKMHVLPGLHRRDREATAELAVHMALKRAPEEGRPPHQGHHLIVTGRQDGVVGFADQMSLLTHYPHATYAALDAAGHNVHLEQPTAVEALLRQWIHAVRG